MSQKRFSFSEAHQASVSLFPQSREPDEVLDSYRSEFCQNSYVHLGRLFSEPTFAKLQTEVARLKKYAKAKNFPMPPYQTLRRMTTLGGQDIRRHSPLLIDLYNNAELRSLVSAICERQIFTCHDDNEWQVVNWLEGPGETHGWHLDDPPLALVIFVEAPTSDQGGTLEYINRWRPLCAEMDLDPERRVANLADRCRAAGLVNSKEHSMGDAYLLRADQCLHRVAPLSAVGSRRTVMNLAFEFEPDIRRIGVTAALLYGTNEAGGSLQTV